MTKIEWTDETWNPVTGCTKVSQGCKNCYAERLAPKVFAGQQVSILNGQKVINIASGMQRPREFTDIICHHERLDAPLHWKKPRRIFVNSMSDLFHEVVPDEFIDSVFAVMAVATQHTYQILTKRAERMFEYLRNRDRLELIYAAWSGVSGSPPEAQDWPLPNVWLGVSVEDQATADERIPLLLQTPAAVRFLSCEPLLGPISIAPWLGIAGRIFLPVRPGESGTYCDGINWCIAGGESGPNARPSHPDWFRALRDQCSAAGVPYFFKQWGEWLGTSPHEKKPNTYKAEKEWNGGVSAWKVGKKAAGRLLDGREHSEYPA